MEYRAATKADIAAVLDLQGRYHVSRLSEEDRKDGFVTTEFSEAQLEALMQNENGLSLACDGARVAAYAMAASWDYWSAWPLFRHMIADLPSVLYKGVSLSVENSYQYGPVCIDMPYRGGEVLKKLFRFSADSMARRYPFLITFINIKNPRSYRAHVDKLGLEVLKKFDFNDNTYYELACDIRRL